MKFPFFSVFLLLTSFAFSGEDRSLQDPYRWLEEDEYPQTMEWLSKQQSQSATYFQKDSLREFLNQLLVKFLNFDTLEVPVQQDENCLFMSRIKGNKQASLYQMDAKKAVHLIVDPVSFCVEGTVSLTGYTVDPKGTLVAYGLSTAGSDWQQWKIRDLETGKDLSDVLTGIKFDQPIWDEQGKGLFYFSFDKHSIEKTSSTTQRFYYHRLGTPSSEDQELFNNMENGLFYFSPFLTEDGRYLLCSKKQGFGDSNGILYADLQQGSFNFVELLPMGCANYEYVGYFDHRLFFVTNHEAPKGKIVSIDPLKSDTHEELEHLLESDTCIHHVCLVGDKLVVSYLKDAYHEMKIFDQKGHLHHQIALPGSGTIGAIKKNSSKKINKPFEFLYSYTDFICPTTIYRADAETGLSEVFDRPQIEWKPQDYQTEQIFYPSKDGTLVPLFIIYKKGLQLNGNHPTLLYGYGGFNISVTPTFSARVLSWLELGGIYALANIRGGSEYGEEWHQGGMLKNKQNVFDDFIAAAEWLCTHHYTNPLKIAINGRSNGGLLVGACLTQRPDLFKAAIVGVGVLDMLRFHLFTVGWSWTSEYGSPDNPEDFENLFAYSPYHQVKLGTHYPATLITTSDHDNRVVPLHSYKFTAALQAAQASKNPVLLRVYQNAGHGFGRSRQQVIKEECDQLYFLIRELQMEVDTESWNLSR